MAEKYGVGVARSDKQHTKCRTCTKRLGKGYVISLGEAYFHADCFFNADDHGATAKQIRHLKATLRVLKSLAAL